jgi:hypothetical protein
MLRALFVVMLSRKVSSYLVRVGRKRKYKSRSQLFHYGDPPHPSTFIIQQVGPDCQDNFVAFLVFSVDIGVSPELKVILFLRRYLHYSLVALQTVSQGMDAIDTITIRRRKTAFSAVGP